MTNDPTIPDQPSAWSPPQPPRESPVDRFDARVIAGAAIVLGTALILFSAVISGLSQGGPGGVRLLIKTVGLGNGFFGPSGRGVLFLPTAGAASAAVALIVALACIHGSEGRRVRSLVPAVAAGAGAEAGWLLLFTLLGLLVDLSLLGSHRFTLVLVAMLGDLASAVLLSAVLFWAVQLLFAERRARTRRA